jgi:hypothetical protein
VFVWFIHVHRTITIKYICGVIHVMFIGVNHDERRTLSYCGGVPAGVVLGDTVVRERSCDSTRGGSQSGSKNSGGYRPGREHRTYTGDRKGRHSNEETRQTSDCGARTGLRIASDGFYRADMRLAARGCSRRIGRDHTDLVARKALSNQVFHSVFGIAAAVVQTHDSMCSRCHIRTFARSLPRGKWLKIHTLGCMTG